MLTNLGYEIEIISKLSWFIIIASPLILIRKNLFNNIKSTVFFCFSSFFFLLSILLMIIQNGTKIEYSYLAFLPMILSTILILPLYRLLPKVMSRIFSCTAFAICVGLFISTVATTTTNKHIAIKLILDTYSSLVIEKVTSESKPEQNLNTCYLEGVPNNIECNNIILGQETYQLEKSTSVIFEDKSFKISEYINYSERNNVHIKITAIDEDSEIESTHLYKTIPNEIERNNLSSISLIVFVISMVWGSLSWFVYIFHKVMRRKKIKV